jgi:hypothetical protein
MLPRAFRRRCRDCFRAFFAVTLGGYFFRVFPEARQALLELVLDQAYCQVSEPLCELGPERLERCDPEGEYAD